MATKAKIAGTSKQRRQGLLRNTTFGPGDALWIAPCEAIHTFGMNWPIDVLFLDRDYRIVKRVARLRPRRIAFCWKAYSVLELPAGTLVLAESQEGDMLILRPN